ncbi:MAG: Maf family protein [Steroidobacteraceae bacterium]
MTEKHARALRRPLLLASTSRYRRELLARLRWSFATESPGVDESALPGEAPAARARRLALAKAQAVAARHPGALVIGSDQVCALGDDQLDKPGSVAAQAAMLGRLSGHSARFFTAVALVCAEENVRFEHLDETRCRFRTLTADDIGRYVSLEPAIDCAGGFKSEGLGVELMERIDSSDPTGLVGLPLIWLAAALRGFEPA